MKFGLSDKHWKILNELVLQPLKKDQVRIWIFGSRARGDHQKYSDIDLLYEFPSDSYDNQNLYLKKISKIKEDIEESTFPIKVDLVDIHELASSYKDSIFSEKIEL